MSPLVLALLAAAGSVVIVPESDAAHAASVTLTSLLQELKVGARTGAAACVGLEGEKRRACAAQAASGAEAAVLVSVAEVRGKLAVALELVARRGAKLLLEDAVRGADAASLKPSAEKIAEALRAIAPAPAAKVAKPGDSKVARLGGDEPDAPVPAPAEKPSPAGKPSEAARALAELPKAEPVAPLPAMPAAVGDPTVPVVRSRAPALLAAGGLVVFLATSIGFGLFAMGEQTRLAQSDDGVSPLRYSDAQKLSGSINLHSGLSYGFGLAGAALLAVTLYFLLRA